MIVSGVINTGSSQDDIFINLEELTDSQCSHTQQVGRLGMKIDREISLALKDTTALNGLRKKKESYKKIISDMKGEADRFGLSNKTELKNRLTMFQLRLEEVLTQ